MRISLLLSIVVISFSMFSCKRYQDGPYISFRSKDARLVNSWNCTSAVTYSSLGATPLLGAETNRVLILNNDGIFNFYFQRIEGNTYVTDSVSGDWILGQNKEALEFDCSIQFQDTAPYDSLFYLDINRLKANNLRLLDAENKEFEFTPLN